MAEIIDIITNIELIAHDEGARKAATAILNLTHEVENLGKKRETLAAKQKFHGNQDVETQKKILHAMQKIDAEIKLKTKLIINERIANSDLNKEIVKEIGLIANLNGKMDALKNKHAMATTAKEVRLVNKEMQALQLQINSLSAKAGTGGLLSTILGGVGLGAGALGFAAIFQGITGFLGSTIEEFEDAERTALGLERSLKVIGQGKYFEGLKNEATTLAERFHNLFDNDDIIKAQNALVTYGKVSRNEISKLLPVILELATAEGIDLVQATEKVINIMEGRGGQVLRDYGISVKGVKSEHDRLNLVLGEFQTKLKGSADVYAETAAGIAQSNKVMLANVEEQLGEYTSRINLIWQKTKLGFFQMVDDIIDRTGSVQNERNFKKSLTQYEADAKLLSDKELEIQVRQNKLRFKEIKKLQDNLADIYAGKPTTRAIVDLRDEFNNQLAIAESFQKEALRRKYKLDADDNKAINKNATLFEEKEKKEKEKKDKTKFFTQQQLDEKFRQQTEKEFNENLKLREEFNQKELFLIDALNATGALTEQEYHDLQLERQLRFFEEQIIFYTDYGKDVYKIRQDQLKALAELDKSERAKNKAIIEKEGPVNSPFPGGATGGMDISDQPASVLTPEGEKAMIDSGKAIKNNNDEIIKSFNEVDSVIQSVGNSIMQVTQIQIDSIDKEISAQQNRIDRAKKYAERGGAELLEIEEERLARLEEKREKYARRQLQINSVLALSNAILAVATAAGETGVGAIAAVPAVIAAIAAGYAVVASFDEPTSFAEGTKSVEGPGTETSDSISARLSKGERVMPAKRSRQFKPILDDIQDGVFANQDALISAIQSGKYNGMNYKAVIDSSNTNTTNNKDVVMAVDRLNTTLENHPVSKVIFDERGFGSYLVKQQQRTLKRNKY